MIRTQRIAAWGSLTTAVALVIVAGAFGALPGAGWRVGVGVATVAAMLVAGGVNRMPWPFLVALGVGGARVGTLSTTASEDPISALNGHQTVASGLTGVALVVALTLALRRRRGQLDHRDLIDGLTVSVSAALVAWIVITSQLIAVHDVDPWIAVGTAVYLPIAAFLFTFMVDLLLAGLASNRSMQMATGAAALHLAATVSVDFALIGVWAPRPHLDASMFAAALLLFAGALIHPDAPETVRRVADGTTDDPYTPFRLSITGACLVFPGVLMAALDSLDRVDATVRVGATVVLVGLVLIRLMVAVRGQQQSHDRLVDRLQTDDLTGLPTRSRFLDVVADVLERTWRSEQRPTVIQLNLDRFKNINDSLGHDEANQVLVVCAERLAALAAEFGGEVARLGGDDFALIDGTTTSIDATMRRAEAVQAAIREPVPVGESSVVVTASLGVAVAPRTQTVSADELLRRSDIATFQAKGSGRNGLAVFDDSMQHRLSRRMDVEHALYGAIGRQEMRLYYQPIVDLATGEVNGFEALMRWQRDGQVVAPLDFIPIAEEIGIIGDLGEWAVNEALTELHRWTEDGVVDPTTTMSVNVSPRQIASPGFTQVVERALSNCGVPADQLWLEVTESMMLEEPELAQTTLVEVQALGVRVALDDFGTGFSSLSMLRQFPIQRIKIDRAFVHGIAEAGNDRSLVRTIIAMGRSLGLDLVAEGVESIQQLQVLGELGCDRAQGFLISHPVPADAMRSTMVALNELASLSLFGAAGTRTGSPTAVSPASRHDEVSAGMPGTARPIGSGVSRPIGQPAL